MKKAMNFNESRCWVGRGVLSVGLGVFLVAGSVRGELGGDLSEVTRLAEGALRGENVVRAVPGFEIRILQDGRAIYHQAFGDWEIDKTARVDSATKTMSAACVISLAETGELGFSLDSRLADFLPSFDTTEKREITVRQAFSHTSGMHSGIKSPLLLSRRLTLRQVADIQGRRALQSAPGTAFAYGSLSMHCAGAAAEVAAGMPFVDLFAARITKPLGLSRTRFYTASEKNPRIDGGVESTASDFGRFMDMLLLEGIDRVTGSRVLAAESVEEMLTRQTTDAMPKENSPVVNNRYGIGVWLEQFGTVGEAVPALAAGARGFHAWIEPEHGIVFVFSTDKTHFGSIRVLASKLHEAVVASVAGR